MSIKKLTIIGLLTITTANQAVELLLTHEPLFLNQSVPPALAITFDDSGSMAWGFMPSGRSYSGWRPSTASTDYNEIYYDPTITYVPPVRFDGTSFPDSNYTGAKFDGFYLGNAGILGANVNLSNSYQMLWSSTPNYATGGAFTNFRNAGRPATTEGYYYLWNGPGQPTRNGTSGPNAGQYTLFTMNSAPATEKTNFANWYTYYNTRGKLAKSAVSHAFVDFGPDFKIDWQQLNQFQYPTGGGTNMDLFTGNHRQNFFSWLYQIPAAGGTPLRQATRQAGRMFLKSGPTGPYYDANFGSELACQQNFHVAISDGGWNGAAGVANSPDSTDTTLPALDPDGVNLVYNYSTTSLPSSMYVGQETETLADNAFFFWNHDLRTDLDNQVPAYIEDYTNSSGNTVVIPDDKEWWQMPELFWNPSNNPATWQHMVNFNIGLGVQGSLDPDTQLGAIRDGTATWPATNTNQGLIDDVWHASLNSRGKYFAAQDPAELALALRKLVANILARRGRASAGSVSSSILGSGDLAFRTGYDTADWSGVVTASKLFDDGTINETIEWDAGCKLTGGSCRSKGGVNVPATNSPASRDIFFYEDGVKSDFKVINMSASLLADINASDVVTNNTSINAGDIIDYIRGDRTLEIQNGAGGGNVLRDRNSLLGDVINSPALVLRGPSAGYVDTVWPDGTPEADNHYDIFRQANKDRTPVLLVGVNDGMLHAFDAGIQTTASGGDELWAYVPSSSFKNLAELADPSYVHTSFVDAAPFVRDAFINGAWRTIAVGNVRHGGKLFYALDLGANPKNEPDVLWEFTDADDPDMGFSYAGGIITRVYDPSGSNVSKWVAFLPNGYSSTNQKSAMYALDLETGALLHKWLSTEGDIAVPNGMGPPVAADYVAYEDATTTRFAADQATDFIYAGDLHGNIYKLDTAKIFSNPGATTTLAAVDHLFDGISDQPITTPPRIFTPNDNTEDVIITFGTGKFIETPDRDTITTPPQYIIGLRDSKDSTHVYTLNDTLIVEQTFINPNSTTFREFINVPVSHTESWKIELPTAGERMVNLLGRNNQRKLLLATTIIPTGSDPCLPGGQSWIMAINAVTGGTPTVNSFFNDGHSDGMYIDDLILGASLLTNVGGNQAFLNLDGLNSSEPIQAVFAKQMWGRKAWHRIILQ